MKKFVVVGLGGRSRMYVDELAARADRSSRLVALCDNNPGRLQIAAEELADRVSDLKTYSDEEFDAMLGELKPDGVVVTTPDYKHHDYICRALRAGCEVVTEKPMTVDEEKCRQIVDTVNETNGSVRVTFNYRYSPPRTQMKELLMSGVIGKILSIDFKWLLDTAHGADYFRRWHRKKKNSGGLMVHKATHHFDLVNWWISSAPHAVAAFGDRVFYTPKQAERYGLTSRSNRCLDCPDGFKCNFRLDMENNENLKRLYLDHETHDGYIRDRCVFSDEITIEDTMNLTVAYKNGVFMSYSLNAFMPWEGYQVSFNGTKGRLEHSCCESSYINGDGTVPGEFQPGSTKITVLPHFQTPYDVEVQAGVGGHGGGDKVLLDDLFGEPVDDPLKRAASHVQGAYSILTGIAANKSMSSRRIVYVDDLVSGLGDPGYTEMPGEDESIEFVADSRKA